MTNTKFTKHALISSVALMVICFTMLLGTTFAWFTDSVVSAGNVITAGNLDIEVEYTLDGENWADLNGANDLFQKGLWEPGHTEVVVLKVTNKGSLYAKYNANMNIVNEVIGKNQDGEDIVLSDILEVGVIIQQAIEADGTENMIGSICLDLAFSGENSLGYIMKPFAEANVLDSDKEIQPGAAHYVFIKVDMPEAVGNEANHDGTNIPSIEFGINLVATQFTKENDSFGPNYDADAAYPIFANSTAELVDALANAKVGSTITLSDTADFGIVTIENDLTGVVIDADGNDNIQFIVKTGVVLDGVTIKNLDLAPYNGNTGSYSGAVNIESGADVDMTFDNCTFRPNSGYAGVRSYTETAELTFANCTFDGGRYAFYKSGAPISSLVFDGCTFKNQSSWIAQTHGGSNPNTLSVTGCTFEGCTGGLFKNLVANVSGSVFTFVDNTLDAACTGHDGNAAKFFELSVSNATVTISGNTLAGAAWEPDASCGLIK